MPKKLLSPPRCLKSRDSARELTFNYASSLCLPTVKIPEAVTFERQYIIESTADRTT